MHKPARLLIFGLCLGLLAPGLVAAEKSQEYFVRQEAGEALLIRINAFEAEIDVRVFAPEHRLLLSSAMPQSRLVPIFQFIDSSDKPRQLDIEVSSVLNTANSKFDIEITRLSVWDQRSASLERAYKLLSFAMQSGSTISAADWTVRINSLMTAGSIFQQYGMRELRFWSAYLVAHLVHHRLHDENLALGLVRELLADLSGSRWQETELAALQLHSAVLIALRRSGVFQTASSGPDPIQSALLIAAQRAEAMGYHYEKAQAIRQSAVEYENQSQLPRALEQFQLALGIADSIGANGLATGIRESIAQIHTGQGNDPATSRVLRELETQLAADGGDELAVNLLQQGQIFIRSYLYPQAIEVLLQALDFENDSSIRSQVNLELAKAHHETGYAADARAFLQAAGVAPLRVQTYFSQGNESAPAGVSGLTESLYRKVQALATAGKHRQAIGVLEQLIDEVLFWRLSVPGVLGAWYWRQHEKLFARYLEQQAMVSGSKQDHALESLLALSKLRYSVSHSDSRQAPDSLRVLLVQRGNTSNIDDVAALDGRIEAEKTKLLSLFKSNIGFLSKAGLQIYMDSLGSNEAVLTYHITESEAHLWIVRHNGIEQRKLVNAAGLHAALHGMGSDNRSPGYASLTPFTVERMSWLGEQLLGPISSLLPDKVYLVASGPLSGLPFDALRLNNRAVVEEHMIVNLLSFPENPKPNVSLKFAPPRNVFLAGHPQGFSAGFATRLETSAEIQTVTDIFRGPGLHIIQAAALLPDEFQGDRFAQADLAHLTMPASIDLGHTERSVLELSEAVRGFGGIPFKQADIRALHLQSKLVFVSASQVLGVARSSMSTQAGVVSAFLDAGAKAVIASLWTEPGGVEDAFIADFYRHLEATEDIASAMSITQRELLQNQQPDYLDWARYQVFID